MWNRVRKNIIVIYRHSLTNITINGNDNPCFVSISLKQSIQNNKWFNHDSCHHLSSWCQWIFIETRMFFNNNTQFSDECVIPNCLHSIPSQFVTTPNGLCQFITNKYSSLSFADNPHISLSLFQEYLLCNWELIHQKTSFHQSWTIVNNKCLFLLFL